MHPLLPLDQLPQGRGVRVEADGTPLALYRDGETVYAVSAFCPHRGGPLDESDLEDGMIYCPWHGWEFDVRTGESPTYGERVTCHEVVVRDGMVYYQGVKPCEPS